MVAVELFDGLLRTHFSPWLQSKGFASQPSPYSAGRSFWLHTGEPMAGVTRIIDFQVASKSNARAYMFTVNFGIYSDIIGRFETGKPSALGTLPPVIAWHSNQRLGFLMPERMDLWWVIVTNGQPRVETWETGVKRREALAWRDLEAFARDLMANVERYGLPALEKYGSDGALRDLWMAGGGPMALGIQAPGVPFSPVVRDRPTVGIGPGHGGPLVEVGG